MNIKPGEYIGVDLDGTLFTYTEWVAWNVFGEPIAPMVERVKKWHSDGIDVRIFTARVGLPLWMGHTAILSTKRWHECKKTGAWYSDADMAHAIQVHCYPYLGFLPPVQCYKDWRMAEFWDDRAVQVVTNTGRSLAEEHHAELAALRGKAQGPVDAYSDKTYVVPASASHGPR